MDPTEFGIYGHHGRKLGTHRTPRGQDRGPDMGDRRVRARHTVDEHFTGSPPPFEWASSIDATDKTIKYSFPSPLPGGAPMEFSPKGNFDRPSSGLTSNHASDAELSQSDSNLGCTPRRSTSTYGRHPTWKPDTIPIDQATSDSESLLTVLGPDNEHDGRTLHDMETEHERQRETLIKNVTPKRRPALLDAVAPKQKARRSSLNHPNPDNDSEAGSSDVSQIFSRGSSPTREGFKVPSRPRTAGDLQSESNRRQSRFLDFHASSERRGR